PREAADDFVCGRLRRRGRDEQDEDRAGEQPSSHLATASESGEIAQPPGRRQFLGFFRSDRPRKLGARRRAPPPNPPAPGHRKITGCPRSEWGELRVPRSLSEPGPGRSASLSSAMKVVGGMQKLLTRTDACPGVGQVAATCPADASPPLGEPRGRR